MHLYVTDTGLVDVEPMKSLSEVPIAMKTFAKESGFPAVFITDAIVSRP